MGHNPILKRGDILIGPYGAFQVTRINMAWVQNGKYIAEATVMDKAGKRGKIVAPASGKGIELASGDVKETLEEHFAALLELCNS